ncbi:MAK10-like protein [Tanacetum coccineum]
MKDVEVHIGKLKLLNDFYVIDMKKDSETPLLVGRGFLATANAVIDCKMAKIAVGEGITRSVFGVKGVDLGVEEEPYWTALGKIELMRYFLFGRHLGDLHVTWAHLEKKRTRLRTNTKTLEDLCSQSLETASQAIHDAVTTHKVTAS